MKVEEAMHKGAEWRLPETPIAELAELMRKEDIGAVPIGENDRLVGMVTDRDIACRGLTSGKEVSRLTARDVMTDQIIYCTTSEELDDAIRLMENHQIRRLPVLNGKKRMVGMLSLGDVSHAASRELSGELVQAVSDHH
ncbi:MAG: CBS domain-containing protein [Alphaproteobacteria bacterium]|nr:CBS domain-containing protein [Alphaproteobacteria bacterium]NNF25013.1 CBS domain-containing protein [Paracoccaceae bacterium]